MAVTVAALQAVLTADTGQFDRSLGDAETRMGRVGGSWKKMAGVIGGLGVGAAVASFGKASVTAALESEKAQARLQSAMEGAGLSMGKYGTEIEKNIQRTSKLAALDDEELSDAFAKLVRTTGDVTKATEGMNLAADIARARNISLESATKAVEKAYNGSATGLRRFGVETVTSTSNMDFLKTKIQAQKEAMEGLTGAALESAKIQLNNLEAQKAVAAQQDKMASGLATLKEAQEQFAGSAEKYGGTAAAAQERFKVAVENLQERIGAKLLPVLARLAEFLIKVVTAIEENWPRAERIIDQAMSVARRVIEALMPTLTKLRDLIENVVQFVVAIFQGDWSRAWGEFKQIAGGALDLVEDAIRLAWETFKKLASALGEKIKDGLKEGLAGIGAAAWSVIDNVGAKIGEMVDTVKGWGSSVGGWVKDAVVGAIVGIGNAAWNVINNIWEFVSDRTKTVQGWGDSIGTWVKNAIVGALGGLGSKLWEAIKEAWDWVKQKVKDLSPIDLPSVRLPFSGPRKEDPFGGSGERIYAGDLQGASPLLGPAAAIGASFGLSVTSGLRAWDTDSKHGLGKAIDLSNTYRGDLDGTPQMDAAFAALASNAQALGLDELFYAPALWKYGFNLDRGMRVPWTVSGHTDHIHAGLFDKGGWLPPKSKTLAINNTPYWEPVGPPGRSAGNTYNITLHGAVGGRQELARWMRDAIAEVERARGRYPFGARPAW